MMQMSFSGRSPTIKEIQEASGERLWEYWTDIVNENLRNIRNSSDEEMKDYLICHRYPLDSPDSKFNIPCSEVEFLKKYADFCIEMKVIIGQTQQLITNLQGLGDIVIKEWLDDILTIRNKYDNSKLKVTILGHSNVGKKSLYKLLTEVFIQEQCQAIQNALVSSNPSLSMASKSSIQPIELKIAKGARKEDYIKDESVNELVKTSHVLLVVLDGRLPAPFTFHVKEQLRERLHSRVLRERLIFVLNHINPTQETKIKEIKKSIQDFFDFEPIYVIALSTEKLEKLFCGGDLAVCPSSCPKIIQQLRHSILKSVLNVIKKEVKFHHSIINHIIIKIRKSLTTNIRLLRKENRKTHERKAGLVLLKGKCEIEKLNFEQYIESLFLEASRSFLIYIMQNNWSIITTSIPETIEIRRSNATVLEILQYNMQEAFNKWSHEFECFSSINGKYHDYIDSHMAILKDTLRVNNDLNEIQITLTERDIPINPIRLNSTMPEDTKLFLTCALTKILDLTFTPNFICENIMKKKLPDYQIKVNRLKEILNEEIQILDRLGKDAMEVQKFNKKQAEFNEINKIYYDFDCFRWKWMDFDEKFSLDENQCTEFWPSIERITSAKTLFANYQFISSTTKIADDCGIVLVRQDQNEVKKRKFYAFDCYLMIEEKIKSNEFSALPILKRVLSGKQEGIMPILLYKLPNLISNKGTIVTHLHDYFVSHRHLIPSNHHENSMEKHKAILLLVEILQQITNAIYELRKKQINLVCSDMRPEAIIAIQCDENQLLVRLCEFDEEKCFIIKNDEQTASIINNNYNNYNVHLPPESRLGLACETSSDVYTIGFLAWQIYYFQESNQLIPISEEQLKVSNHDTFSCATFLTNYSEIMPEKLQSLIFNCMLLNMAKRPLLKDILVQLEQIKNEIGENSH